MRRVSAALLAWMMTSAAAGAAPKLVSSGELTWGVSTTFAPFEFQDDDHVVGFDVDLMAEIAGRLGLTSEPLTMDYAGIIPALASGGRIDAAVSGIYITAARLEAVDMIPYLIIGDQIFVPAANPGRLSSKDDLCGHRVAVAGNTNFEVKLDALDRACVMRGKPAVDVLTLANSAAVALALAQGRAEGALSSSANVASIMAANPGTYVTVGPAFDVDTKVGIGVSKENPELRGEIASALTDMGRDGTYSALLVKWRLGATASIF